MEIKDSVFYEHRDLVLGVAAFSLGVWWAANGLVLSTYLLAGLLVFGLWILRLRFDFLFVLVLLLAIGSQRYFLAVPVFEPMDLAYYQSEDERVVFEGRIVDYPDVRDDRIKLTLEADRLFDGESEDGFEILGRVLVTVNRYPEYFYGDRIRVEGVLQEPATFDDFSYKHYLRRYGIDSVMYYPRVELLEEAFYRDWRSVVYRLKAAVEDRLNRLFSEPYASFSAGLLLGSRRGIPEDLMEDFNTSGLTHIIAISGYNITLIIVFVSGLLRFLPKRSQIVIATTVIVVFVVLVGGTAAVVRAAIMGVLGLWAIWFGRQSEVTRLLAITAGAMIVWNPFILVDDVGFQLSFAATCGLVYMTSYVECFLQWIGVYRWIPEVLSIREAFITTLAAQTLAVPIIIANFERFSLVAPFANVAAVSLIPLAMVFSFLAVLLSYIWFSAGLVAAYVGWFFLESIIQIAYWSARIPWASLDF